MNQDYGHYNRRQSNNSSARHMGQAFTTVMYYVGDATNYPGPKSPVHPKAATLNSALVHQILPMDLAIPTA